MTNSAEPHSDGPTAGDTDRPAAPGRRRVGLLAGIAAAVVVVDLITKLIAVATLEPGVPVRALGGLVYFTMFRNAGAAFSFATGMTWVLSLIVIAVIVVIIRMASRLRSTAWAICLGLVLGGAIGNLIDRIFRSPGFLRGHVVDFISLFEPDGAHFAVFNVADSAITIGGVCLVITALLGIDFDGRRVKGGREDPATTGPADGQPGDSGERTDRG